MLVTRSQSTIASTDKWKRWRREHQGEDFRYDDPVLANQVNHALELSCNLAESQSRGVVRVDNEAADIAVDGRANLRSAWTEEKTERIRQGCALGWSRTSSRSHAVRPPHTICGEAGWLDVETTGVA